MKATKSFAKLKAWGGCRTRWCPMPPLEGEFEMKIDHLVNGKVLPGKTYFEDIDPATQEVLAEVASGGEAEINAAVAAARAAFPGWSATPQAQRARIMRKLGDLIGQHVPELAEWETRDTGQVIGQTKKALVPRAADNFYYFAEMCTRTD